MKKLLLSTILLSFLYSCQNGPTQAEFDQLKSDLESCSNENKELTNTPENRLLTAQKLETSGNIEKAENEYRELATKFPKTEQGSIAQKFIEKREIEKEKLREEEDRKKRLGFKALKEDSSIEQGDVKLTFSKIQLTKRWYFDRYDSRYFYRDAERGNKHLTATLSIKSKTNEPKLPPIYVYKLQNGQLKFVSTVGYEFYRWKDYGSYLGNYADYGNDFAHSPTIRFSPGVELSDEITKDLPIFLMVKKDNCVIRETVKYGNPEVAYTTSICDADRILDVDKASKDYFTIKVLNRNKL